MRRPRLSGRCSGHRVGQDVLRILVLVGVGGVVAVTTVTSSRASWAAALGTLWLVTGITSTVAEGLGYRWRVLVIAVLCVATGIVLVTVFAPGAFLWWAAAGRWWDKVLVAGSWYAAGCLIATAITKRR